MAPLFSIITVTLNAESTIAATIKSIASQSCTLFEWIVQDGGSTDGTLQMIEDAAIPGTKVVSERDGGLYDGMNRGLARASGDYVIFLNAGDAFHSPSVLELVADKVMDNDYPGIVYGQTILVDSDRNYVAPRHLTAPEHLSVDSFKEGMVVCHQAFIVLRKLAGDFDTRYRFSADYEWCIRCLEHSRRNCYIPDILIDYLNEGVTTRNHKRSLRERYHIMCRYYGTIPTILRHVGFALRYLRHSTR